MTDEELLEKLALLEHDQWMYWSKKTYMRLLDGWTLKQFWNNWSDNWVPYPSLAENVKEFDREWARKVLELIRQARTKQ